MFDLLFGWFSHNVIETAVELSMTNVTKGSSDHGRSKVRHKRSRQKMKTRRSAAQSVAPAAPLKFVQKSTQSVFGSMRSEQFSTKELLTDVISEITDYPDASSLDVGYEVQPRTSLDAVSTLPPIHVIGDGIGVVPLSNEDAKASLGIPKVYVGEDNEYYATYSVSQAASQLNVEQFVVKRWIDSGKLVGLTNKKGELRVPKAQIRHGRIAPYLDKLRHIYEKPADLWQYLVTERFVENEQIRPLDVHFQENLRRALDLSVSLRMDFT